MKDKLKSRFEELLKDGRSIILVLFLLLLLLNFFIIPNIYYNNVFDDMWFMRQFDENSIVDYTSMRYNEWGSRVILENTLCVMLKLLRHSKLIWILANTIMITLVGYSMSKLFVKENKKEMNTMILFLVLLYPLSRMQEAGWGSTSLVYMWTLSMGLFSLIPIRKILDKEKISWYMYPLYSLALIYAGNQEQSCMIVLASYILFTIILILRDKKKIHPFMIIQSLLMIASLVFILTCPGNYVRTAEETARFFPNFETLTLLDKVSLGTVSTITKMILDSSIIFLIFSVTIATYIYTCHKNKLYRIISAIPVISILVFGIFKDLFIKLFPHFQVLIDLMTVDRLSLEPSNVIDIVNNLPIADASNYRNILSSFPIIFSLVIIFCFALSILLIFKKLKNNTAIVIFGLGILSRIAMGLSPTIFASQDRTFIFLEFAMLIIVLLIWQEFIKVATDRNDRKSQNLLYNGIKVAAILQYINTFIFVLFTQI